MKILSLLTLLSFSLPSFAQNMTVVCSGKASSGNRYRVNMSIDESRASFATPSGIKRFDLQNVELEQFNSDGKRVSHHIETLNDFTVVPPSLEDPGQYAFLASGKQSIMIAGFGEDAQILKLDVGRFRGIELNRAECQINGQFVNKANYQDNVNRLIENAQKTIEQSKRNNRASSPKAKGSAGAQ